jgi:hypothetical protein
VNTLPSELIAVPGYHGYFWHPQEEVVYSLKMGGTLRPLKLAHAVRYAHYFFPTGFNVCRDGRRRRLDLDWLRKLRPHPYKVPYESG